MSNNVDMQETNLHMNISTMLDNNNKNKWGLNTSSPDMHQTNRHINKSTMLDDRNKGMKTDGKQVEKSSPVSVSIFLAETRSGSEKKMKRKIDGGIRK
jgi:hypothetical protein